ncbi:hypothetical protein CAPN010_16550 [Capnocytophaga cynodegmi]|uniref:hypothetical protein n=1 Tax=Capnocytophaga cynodegmi TaxID=28189 RepID=UPI001EE29599|nr:hypothetical protein [Capnocytophaga cynodegmi]GJQ07497.1 hypothetical protein CAPN010_16550 [Capnocytophaga cynodegmi]
MSRKDPKTTTFEFEEEKAAQKARAFFLKHKERLDKIPVRYIPSGLSGEKLKHGDLKKFGRILNVKDKE